MSWPASGWRTLRTFDAMHRLVGRLIAAGQLQGSAASTISTACATRSNICAACRALSATRGRPGRAGFIVVVEKILAEDEPLPRFPGVAGTTGYEWLNVISHVLLDRRGLDALDRDLARDFRRQPRL